MTQLDFYRDIDTSLEINGPTLSFTLQPTGAFGNYNGSVQLVGIATAKFTQEIAPGITTGIGATTGNINYRWYKEGTGFVSDGAKYVGTGTTTLTITGIATADHNSQYFLVIDYVPDPYPANAPNAWNEPFTSGIATVGMYGFIQINSQPTASTIIPNTDTEFEIDASLNDSSTSGMGYQWQMNGNDITNGTFSTQNITITPGTPTSEEVINYNFSASATGSSANNTFTVPAGAENVRVSIAGAPGGNGAAEGGNAGGVGGHGMSAWFDVLGSVPTGQQAYTTPGTYQWTCPAGVGKVCVVCIGGGGGYTDGSASTFDVPADNVAMVAGYGRGSNNTTPNASMATGGDANYAGGLGHSSSYGAGGGGAAGYNGNGMQGLGGANMWTSAGYITGSGSGASGGSFQGSSNGDSAGLPEGGGGTGIFGNSGDATFWSKGGSGGDDSTNEHGAKYGGGGGNPGVYGDPTGEGGGLCWKNNITVVPGQTYTVVVGYGGSEGGFGGGSNKTVGSGGGGAVRIIWGANRSFPSQNTVDINASSGSSPNARTFEFVVGKAAEDGTSGTASGAGAGGGTNLDMSGANGGNAGGLGVSGGGGGGGGGTHLKIDNVVAAIAGGGGGAGGGSAGYDGTDGGDAGPVRTSSGEHTPPTVQWTSTTSAIQYYAGTDAVHDDSVTTTGGSPGTPDQVVTTTSWVTRFSGFSFASGNYVRFFQGTFTYVYQFSTVGSISMWSGQSEPVVNGSFRYSGGSLQVDGGNTWVNPSYYSITAEEQVTTTTVIPGTPATPGTTTGRDGGGAGAGGGGAGTSSATAGTPGNDNSSAATGGDRGTSAYRSDMVTLTGGSYNPKYATGSPSNGYGSVYYSVRNIIPGTPPTTNITTVNHTASGATTDKLTIQSDGVGINTVRCVVSNSGATNTPVESDEVNYNVVSTISQATIKIETIGIGTAAVISTHNLASSSLEINVSGQAGGQQNMYQIIYSPDRDIDIEMDMYGGAGFSTPSFAGGQGGYARIRFTLKQNEEYTLSGLIGTVNTPYLYHRSSLIACCGGGGNAGNSGDGGDGGGVGVAGASGTGSGAGSGGQAITAGTLTSTGIFGSLYQGLTAIAPDTNATGQQAGKTIPCTKGVYWAQQAYTPCQDMGLTRFRQSDGTEVLATTNTIDRGFKAGYDITQTAGQASGTGGNGGNGATGGDGGTNGGGGGGSGYTDGSVTIVSASQGGSVSQAKVVLRVVT